MRLFGMLTLAALTACNGTPGTPPSTEAPTAPAASSADKATGSAAKGDKAPPQPLMVRSKPADKPVAKKVAWTSKANFFIPNFFNFVLQFSFYMKVIVKRSFLSTNSRN